MCVKVDYCLCVRNFGCGFSDLILLCCMHGYTRPDVWTQVCRWGRWMEFTSIRLRIYQLPVLSGILVDLFTQLNLYSSAGTTKPVSK